MASVCNPMNKMLKDKYMLNDSIVFTIFATFIANFGLYSNNSLIIAGSKLLAPILGPITYLLYDHITKKTFTILIKNIILLIAIVLTVSYLLSHIIPHGEINLIKTMPILDNENQKYKSIKLIHLYGFLISCVCGIIYILTIYDGIQMNKGFMGELFFLIAVSLSLSLLPAIAACGIFLQQKKYKKALNSFLLFIINIVGFLTGAFTCKQFVCS